MRLFAHFVGRVDLEVLAHICEIVGGDIEDLGIEGYLKWKYEMEDHLFWIDSDN